MARRVGFGEEGTSGRDDQPRVAKGTRILGSLFLMIWLAVWAYGIFFVGAALIDPNGTVEGIGAIAMGIWLVIAVIGFFFGLRILHRLMRGEPPLKRRRWRPEDGPPPPPSRNTTTGMFSDGGHGGDGGDGSG
ncbi:MAG: hypothetical protein AAF367_17900 [Pseudomonadota bacterium]